MKKVTSNEELKNIINNNKMVIVYFTGSSCGACEVIKVKVEDILKKYKEIESVEVNGEQNVDVAAAYGVFSLPIFLLYIEGKEFLRQGRNSDLLKLQGDIERYYNMIF